MAPRKKPKSKIRLAQAVEMAAGEAARCYLRHRSSEDQEITGQRLAVEPQPVDYVTQRAPVLRCRGLTASRPSARGVQESGPAYDFWDGVAPERAWSTG